MGGMKDREAKKKANNVFSGGSGGGCKGPSIVDKRKQELQCPYCERVFQQKERFNKHIERKHAEEHAAAQQDEESTAQQQPGPSRMMQAGSKAGYYTKKSPHLLLIEQCQIDKRIKPRIRVLNKANDKYGCRVVFPDSKKADLDVLVYLPDEYLADTEDEAKQNGCLAALHRIAGHRALERILPEEFLTMWERLGELQAAKDAREEQRAAREQKQQARQAKEKQREMKDILSGHVVSMPEERIDELTKLVMSDKLTAASASGDAPLPLPGDVRDSLARLGCSPQLIHDVTVGLSAGGSLEEVLDWLCMNVANSELPSALRGKRGGTIRVVTGTNDAAIKTEEGRLLTALGFSQADVASALKVDSVEPRSLAVACWAKLVAALTGFVCSPTGPPVAQLHACLQELPVSLTEPSWPEPEGGERAMWWNEQLAFISVYPELVLHASSHCCRIKVEIPEALAMMCGISGDHGAGVSAELVVVFWEGCGHTLPLIGLHCRAMPPALRLHYTQQVYQHLKAEGSTTEGALHTAFSFLSEQLHASTPPSLTEARIRWSTLLQPDQKDSSNAGVSEEVPSHTHQKPKPRRTGGPSARVQTAEQLSKESERLKVEFQRTRGSAKGREMQAARDRLPAAAKKGLVMEAVAGHRVVVISGATGCGKSTQVPQFILEASITAGTGAATNIICTQPRRLPAIALANRVSDEMCQPCGSLVGYSIRLEKKMCKGTRLLFCTTGILLRRLISDRQLADVSHIVMDEVHERSLESDLLMLLLKDVLQGNKQLKLVLMSATAESDLFASYFETVAREQRAKGAAGSVRVVDIPGFTYPVRELSLEDAVQRLRDEGVVVPLKEGKYKEKDVDKRSRDLLQLSVDAGQEYDSSTLSLIAKADGEVIDYDLVEAAICHVVAAEAHGGPWALLEGWSGIDEHASKGNSVIEGHGAILVFLPGSIEISKLQRQLAVSEQLRGALGNCQAELLPLHGALSPAQQQAVFRRYSKHHRKIILSTNIAETSLTIDDVTVVIDTGKMKEIQLDQASGITKLAETWVSQAGAKQRRGRAGRVRPGVCIRLFSRLQWSKLRANQLPEMLRVPLEPLCLQIKATLSDMPVEEVLAKAITPPPVAVVGRAMQLLKQRQALDSEGNLTALGRHLSQMPLDPAVGKMLIFGSLLQCADPLLTVAATISYSRQVFMSPQTAREEADAARRVIAGPSLAFKSDHLATVYAFAQYRTVRQQTGDRGARAWCTETFVSHEGMRAIQDGRAELVNSLLELGFVSTEYARKVRRGSEVNYGEVQDANSQDARIVKSAICAGFYPQVLRVENPAPKFAKLAGGAVETDEGSGIPKLFERSKGRVFVHPSSINFSVTKYDTGWMVYSDITETSKVFVRQCSSVPVYALLLFGGAVQVHHTDGKVSVDTWAKVSAAPKIGVLVRELKKRLDTLLLVKLEQPETAVSQNAIVSVVIDLLITDGK